MISFKWSNSILQIYAGEGNTLEVRDLLRDFLYISLSLQGVTEHYLNTVTAFLENCFHNDRYAEALWRDNISAEHLQYVFL